MRNLFLFVVVFCSLVNWSYCYQFVAGGRDGWVVKPSEKYNEWASRMRFQVNDTILFKYKSGSDSVLVVKKDDYDSCNVGNPLLKFNDGNSIFKFDRSGPFYFISGNKPNCDQGQKLIVVVLAVRTPPSPLPPQAGAPSPAGGAAAPGPGSAGAPSQPGGGSPAPANSPLAPSPAGSGSAPEGALPGAPGPSVPGSPESSMPGAPGPSVPGSPESSMPGSPESSMPGSPGSSMPGSPGSSTPGSGTPADANSPPRSLAAPPCTGSVFLMSVLTVGLGVFLFSPLNN